MRTIQGQGGIQTFIYMNPNDPGDPQHDTLMISGVDLGGLETDYSTINNTQEEHLEQLRRRVAPFLDRFSAGIEKDAFFYLLSLRLIPFFPFFAVNIAPAMLKISLTTYAMATLLGIAPAVYVYTSLGAGVADLSELTVDPREKPGTGAAAGAGAAVAGPHP